MKLRYLLVVVFWLMSVAAFAQSPNPTKGQILHDNQCLACHGAMTQGQPERIYTRKERRVKDFNGLANQVQRCEQQLGLGWFDSEIQDVTAYLNKTYYQFLPD